MRHHRGARRLITYSSTVLALVLGGATLTACDVGGSSTASNPHERIAFVYSTRANQPALDVWNPSPLDDEILDAVATNGVVTFHSTNGEPSTVGQLSLEVRTSNPQVAKQDRVALAKRIREYLESSVAESPEADVLAGIADAADEVRGSDHPTIIVIDNGLPTVGSASFPQTGLLSTDADIAATVSTMASARMLPDLTGVTLRWYGMGETASPQGRLDEAAQSRLEDIWQTVVESAGGTLNIVTQGMATTDAPADLPDVTPVDPSPTSVGGLTVSLPESVLPFVADEATFLDPAAAQATVASVAGQITASGLTRTVVTGCTAMAGTPEGRHALSTDRAQAVADLLVANGVPAASVTVQGKGAQCPGRVNDVDDAGALIEAAARANRVVIIEAS